LKPVQCQNHFKTKHALSGTLMETGPVRDAQQTKQCAYSIPCDCGRCYIGETSRPSQVHIKEQKYNLTQGLIEKTKLAQHAYEGGHKICWKEAKVLQIEWNITYTKQKEPAHMSLLDHPISQPSLDISPIWTLPLSQQKSRNYCSVKGRLCVKFVSLSWYQTENLFLNWWLLFWYFSDFKNNSCEIVHGHHF
jgi:hypothetical protein